MISMFLSNVSDYLCGANFTACRDDSGIVFQSEKRVNIKNHAKKMPDDVKNTLMIMYSDKIYKLIEDRDEIDDGDFAGAIGAIVLTLLNGNHDDMYKHILKMGA